MQLQNTSTVNMDGTAGYSVRRSDRPGAVAFLTLGRADADNLRDAFAEEQAQVAAEQATFTHPSSPRLALARHTAAVLLDISASYVDWEVAYGHEEGTLVQRAYNDVANALFAEAHKILDTAGFDLPAPLAIVHHDIDAANEEIARLRLRLAVHDERGAGV